MSDATYLIKDNFMITGQTASVKQSLTLAFLRRINYNKCAALQQKQTQEIEFLWLSTVS